jgi:hypothetical protein
MHRVFGCSAIWPGVAGRDAAMVAWENEALRSARRSCLVVTQMPARAGRRSGPNLHLLYVLVAVMALEVPAPGSYSDVNR